MSVMRTATFLQVYTVDDLKRVLTTFPVTNNAGDMSAFDSCMPANGVRFKFGALSYLRDQVIVNAYRGSQWSRDVLLLRDANWILRIDPPSPRGSNIPLSWKTEPDQEPSGLDQTPWDLVHPKGITNDKDPWELVSEAEADESSQLFCFLDSGRPLCRRFKGGQQNALSRTQCT